MDFGDQLRRAAAGGPRPPGGRREVERDRFRVVLLDEYQDTSHAQVVLLRSLFGGGHPVTAVGDPCQSIYGWRGASAGTLDRFPTDFPARRRPAAAAALRELAQRAGDPGGGQRAVAAPLRANGLAVRSCAAPARSAAGVAGRTGALRAARHVPRRGRLARGPRARRLAAGRQVTRTRRVEIPVTPPTTAVLVRARSADPGPGGGAARARPAGRGGRPGRAARHPRGPRRGQHAAGARRPDRRARRCCGCSPARGGGSGRGTWSPCTGGPGRSSRAPPATRRRPTSRTLVTDRLDEAALVEALDDLGARRSPTRTLGYRAAGGRCAASCASCGAGWTSRCPT